MLLHLQPSYGKMRRATSWAHQAPPSFPPVETQHPSPGRAHQPETRRVTGAAPEPRCDGAGLPVEKSILAPVPKGSRSLGARCGGASDWGIGGEKTTGDEFTLNLATQPQISAAWVFSQAPGEKAWWEGRRFWWVICNLLPWEGLSLNPARHLAHACPPHGFRGS